MFQNILYFMLCNQSADSYAKYTMSSNTDIMLRKFNLEVDKRDGASPNFQCSPC